MKYWWYGPLWANPRRSQSTNASTHSCIANLQGRPGFRLDIATSKLKQGLIALCPLCNVRPCNFREDLPYTQSRRDYFRCIHTPAFRRRILSEVGRDAAVVGRSVLRPKNISLIPCIIWKLVGVCSDGSVYCCLYGTYSWTREFKAYVKACSGLTSLWDQYLADLLRLKHLHICTTARHVAPPSISSGSLYYYFVLFDCLACYS